MERIDPDPLKKALPQLFLSLGLFKTLLDQFGVELRFAQRGLSLSVLSKARSEGRAPLTTPAVVCGAGLRAQSGDAEKHFVEGRDRLFRRRRKHALRAAG